MKSATLRNLLKRKILALPKRKILALPVTLFIVFMLYYSGNTDEVNNQLILEAQAQSITPIYWAYITDTIEGASTVFGGLITLVIRVVALIIVITVIGFITGVFGNVMSAVKSKLK